MSVASARSAVMPNQIFDQSAIRTTLWGVVCYTGLQYNQLVRKKYCITQAILDPFSDSSSDYVLVMFVHKDVEYIMAVLKHGKINQVNLNMHFDHENVTFYLKGKGTVHLLGYEILDPSDETYNERNFASSPVVSIGLSSKTKKKKGKKSEKIEIDNVSSKRSKKVKHLHQSILEEPESPKPSCSKDSTNKLAYFEDLDDDDDEEDEDDDEDFSMEDEEASDSEDGDDISDDDVSEEIEASEVRKLEEDLEDMDELPEPPSSRRKRREEVEQAQKRRKTEGVNPKKKAKNVVIDDDESVDSESDLSEADDSGSDEEQTPLPKKALFTEDKSAEKLKIIGKMKKKPEKKINDLVKLNKSQQTKSPVSKKLDSGFEVEDVKIGHGPPVVKGKMVHVYYVGRLADKTIFDSRTRGNKPFSFVYGSGKVIKGWEVGLEGMQSGGKRRLTIPPSMGYGKAAIEGIPSNSTLYFVIEVVAIS